MKKNYALIFIIMLWIAFIFGGCKKESFTPGKVPQQAGVLNASAQTDSLELTPFGWVAKSKIITIEKGYQLTIRDGYLTKTEKETGKIIQDIGRYNRPVKSPQDAKIRNLNSVSSTIPYTVNPNWILDTKWNSAVPITYFSTTYIVPNPPTQNNGQVLYIFNGLSDNGITDIIQPVLRWYNGSWQINNWYVYPGGGSSPLYIISPYTTVSPGTSLTGVINYTGQKTDGSRNFTSSFSGTGNSLTITETATVGHAGVPFIPDQTWAFEALEAYNSNVLGSPVPSLSADYPADVKMNMTGINIATGSTHPTMSWVGENNVTNFGQHIDVISSNTAGAGEVDMQFHLPPPLITINGQASVDWLTGSGYKSGTINAPAGTLVHIQVSSYGPGTTMYFVIHNVTLNGYPGGVVYISNNYANPVPTFYMPAGGSVTWDATFTRSGTSGTGGIGVN